MEKAPLVLHFKNMYSKSCIRLIERELLTLMPAEQFEVKLGFVSIAMTINEDVKKQLIKLIEGLGFTQVYTNEQRISEAIKLAAIELIFHAMNINSLIRNSDYISDKLGIPYEKLSRIFSKETGATLEKYLIILKIEKVKKLIHHDEFTLSEIAYMLGYSSVQYLSNQFKKATGFTVSEFKHQTLRERIAVEDLLESNYYKTFLNT